MATHLPDKLVWIYGGTGGGEIRKGHMRGKVVEGRDRASPEKNGAKSKRVKIKVNVHAHKLNNIFFRKCRFYSCQRKHISRWSMFIIIISFKEILIICY